VKSLSSSRHASNRVEKSVGRSIFSSRGIRYSIALVIDSPHHRNPWIAALSASKQLASKVQTIGYSLFRNSASSPGHHKASRYNECRASGRWRAKRLALPAKRLQLGRKAKLLGASGIGQQRPEHRFAADNRNDASTSPLDEGLEAIARWFQCLK